MMTFWAVFSILLAITALYFFLSVYLLFRMVSGYVFRETPSEASSAGFPWRLKPGRRGRP